MAIQVGSNRGIHAEVNVVPLIDILLVLLVIFMIIPHHQKGLEAAVPQPGPESVTIQDDTAIVIQVRADGELRINQDPVSWKDLGPRLEAIFKERAHRVAFIRGDAPVEFAQVARVVDIMSGSGISVGLLTPGLEQIR